MTEPTARGSRQLAGRWVTIGSLAGSVLLSLSSVFEPLGTAWTNALLMVVIPLVVTHLLVAIGSFGSGRQVGRLGGLSMLLFLALLVAAAGYTLTLGPFLLKGMNVDPETVAALRAAATSSPVDSGQGFSGVASFVDWLVNMVPRNPIRAAVDGDILPIVVFTVVFALAMTRLPTRRRESLLGLFRGVADAVNVLVYWILLAMPVAVFALGYVVVARSGPEIVGALGYWVLMICFMLLAFTALLYPLTSIVGRVRARGFARGVAGAQLVAIGTRSSLASLPALLDGADNRLGMSNEVSSLVLPLAVSTFKLNRTISAPAKALFLTQLYGIAVGPQELLVFVLVIIFLSFSAPGIPDAGPGVTIPFYLALGIPIEGIVLISAVVAIPDVFKTLVNTTANMSVAVIVARLVGQPVASTTTGETDGVYVE
jgi:Na+/H+-dicarboxylate symporter